MVPRKFFVQAVQSLRSVQTVQIEFGIVLEAILDQLAGPQQE
jgi:hypothetical protein